MRYVTLLWAIALTVGCECREGAAAPQEPAGEPGVGEAPVAEEPAAPPAPSPPPGAAEYEWTRVQWLVAEANRGFSIRDEAGDFTTWQAETSPRSTNTLVITMQPKPATVATLAAIADPAERERRFLSMRDSDAEQVASQLRTLAENHDMLGWPVVEIRTAPPSTLSGVPVHAARVLIDDWPALHPSEGFRGFQWSSGVADVPLTRP